ncbi:uncharacterized protein BYT42DRAFT_569634 [Radiomyces spectabilis]|uniref:uncharacterized protein n=1 Tax=Radiomyces spectabilis TaxID=64574 RepID=UPI00221F2F85|nr:uncharacterized protein BYT42DRAFT_569634 [Radiomyces spectabilis]KAI8379682.1 hypothetical protein BYT42DRAFT_569634 [Radiomyces spectabilis]
MLTLDFTWITSHDIVLIFLPDHFILVVCNLLAVFSSFFFSHRSHLLFYFYFIYICIVSVFFGREALDICCIE